jgi:hypothetical protein
VYLEEREEEEKPGERQDQTVKISVAIDIIDWNSYAVFKVLLVGHRGKEKTIHECRRTKEMDAERKDARDHLEEPGACWGRRCGMSSSFTTSSPIKSSDANRSLSHTLTPSTWAPLTQVTVTPWAPAFIGIHMLRRKKEPVT